MSKINIDSFYDLQTVDDFLDCVNRIKDKFCFLEPKLLLVIESSDQFEVTLLDFESKLKLTLLCCFKPVKLILSPFSYSHSETDHKSKLVLIVGLTEVLSLAISKNGNKFHISSLEFFNKIDFLWQKIVFVDPFRILVQTVSNELCVRLLDPMTIGRFYFPLENDKHV